MFLTLTCGGEFMMHAVILALGASAIRLVRPECADTIELVFRDGYWLDEQGRQVTFDVMFLAGPLAVGGLTDCVPREQLVGC